MTTLFGHEVRDLTKESDGSWTLKVRNRRTGESRTLNAKFVFIGAGGGALPLLQKSGIKEAKGFGGFPIGGEFLRTGNPAIAAAHRAKVYGLPPAGRTPMSAPHLDTRVINGEVHGCCSGRSPVGRRSSSSRARSPICRCRSSPTIWRRWWGSASPRWSLVKYLIGQLRQSASPTGSTRCANSRPAQWLPTGN